MKLVLDASVFFIQYPLEGEMFTTPSVIGELKDLRSRGRYETLLAEGLVVYEPSKQHREVARGAAVRTGDAPVISSTDIDILALALELEATLVTDDFAVQNIAHRLHVAVQPIQQRKAQPRQWRYRCSGCGRYADKEGICEFCGAPIKRKLK